MLNKPKFMSPSTNIQECTIDINADEIPFSCIIDGNEAIYAWRIKIYRLNDNVLVYNTGKITYEDGVEKHPSLPFFPINEKNQNVMFKVNLKDYPTIAVPTKDSFNKTITPTPEFINASTTYYWTIEFWNNVDNTAEGSEEKSTTMSCEEAFYANSVPIVTLMYKAPTDSDYSAFPSNGYDVAKFVTNNYSFKASYKQDEDIAIKRYGWRIIDSDSGQILMDTISQNQIYGTSENILCSYKGFLNNNNYSIEVYIETQNNAIYTSLPTPFFVSYQTTFLTNDFVTEFLKNEAAVRNSWGEAKAIEGEKSFSENTYIAEYPIVGSGTTAIKIPSGESIVYDYGTTSNLDISEESYIVLSFQLLDASDTDLFFAEGIDDFGNSVTRKLSFKSGRFEYIISDPNGGYFTEYHTPSDGYKPNKYVWYVVIMAPCFSSDKILTVVESRAENGLYPKINQYPSTSLYPSFGEWVTKTTEEV